MSSSQPLVLPALVELTGSEPGPVQGQHSNSSCSVSLQEECLSDKPLLCAKASTITEKLWVLATTWHQMTLKCGLTYETAEE